jgi:hypothetical protein
MVRPKNRSKQFPLGPELKDDCVLKPRGRDSTETIAKPLFSKARIAFELSMPSPIFFSRVAEIWSK